MSDLKNWKQELVRMLAKLVGWRNETVDDELFAFIESLLAAREKEWVEVLESIINADKTPRYIYGTSERSRNTKGKLPGIGKRWNTPREIASEALQEYKQGRITQEEK